MNTRTLNSVDAFVVIDLPAADRSSGIVRCARKVLVDGAANLARSVTYGWALLGERRSGASAGINAEGDAVADTVGAFATELADEVAAGRLALDAGKGVHVEALAGAWGAADGGLASRFSPAPCGTPAATLNDELAARGALAAADVALGGLSDRRVVIEPLGPRSEVAAALATAAGAEVVAPGASGAPATEADVLLVGSKPGLIDHDLAAALPHRVIAPLGPLPITARGLAVAGRAGIVVLPDFLTLLGGRLAEAAAADTALDELCAATEEAVRGRAEAALGRPEGPYLGACVAAEEFLATWCDELPFGRPIA